MAALGVTGEDLQQVPIVLESWRSLVERDGLLQTEAPENSAPLSLRIGQRSLNSILQNHVGATN